MGQILVDDDADDAPFLLYMVKKKSYNSVICTISSAELLVAVEC